MSPQTLEFPSGGPWTIKGVGLYEPCPCSGLRAAYHEIFERHRGKIVWHEVSDRVVPGESSMTLTVKADGTFTLD